MFIDGVLHRETSNWNHILNDITFLDLRPGSGLGLKGAMRILALPWPGLVPLVRPTRRLHEQGTPASVYAIQVAYCGSDFICPTGQMHCPQSSRVRLRGPGASSGRHMHRRRRRSACAVVIVFEFDDAGRWPNRHLQRESEIKLMT